MTPDPFTDQEYTRRIDALAAELESQDIDALVAFTSSWFRMPGAVRYCCGYEPYFGSAMFVFVRDSGARYVLTNNVWDVLGRPEEVDRTREELQLVDDLGEALARILPARVKRVGIVDERWMPAPVFTSVREHLADRELVDARGVLDHVREVKSEPELALLRETAAISDAATRAFFEHAVEGASEVHVANEMLNAARQAGADGFWTPIMVASGPRSALYYTFPTARVLTGGDIVHTDVGINLAGYHGDTQRSVVIPGRAAPEGEELLAALIEIQAILTAELVPGLLASDVYQRWCELVAERKLSEYIAERWNSSVPGCESHEDGKEIGALVGHGIGSDGHESPDLAPQNDTPLRRNMVVTLEPMLFIDGVGGVGIEDMVLITDDGGEHLTQTPQRWQA